MNLIAPEFLSLYQLMLNPTPVTDPIAARRVAFSILQAIEGGAFADVALHRDLARSHLSVQDRGFVTELVYGTVRQQRTLDALIDSLGTLPATKQPPMLLLLLRLGLYQLRYLQGVPAAAAVNTTVELAKENRLGRLSGVANGLLRHYVRCQEAGKELLPPPENPVAALGIRHSFPDWIVDLWVQQIGLVEAEQLCQWFNQSPTIDLRVNRHRTSVEEVQAVFAAAGIDIQPIPGVPYGLRLLGHEGAVNQLPGYDQGWWTVQDASAQLVGQLLDPQPGELVLDVCAAPGGKATQLAELMGDEGIVWACDRTPSRLKKVRTNAQRLNLASVHIHTGDSRQLPQFHNQADRVLVDAPCSGLGTLHRHADARWRQSPNAIQGLAQLQQELLTEAARCVKPDGSLVYATCTLHPAENEAVITEFLQSHPEWSVQPVTATWAEGLDVAPQGWLKVWPHRHQMDGFFMAKLGQL
jgi:16S rRNA (cytosine967-C5)-methyltransferase